MAIPVIEFLTAPPPPELIRIFENKLKELNPDLRNLTYELRDLQKYIDHLTDAVALVYARSRPSVR